MNRDDRFDLLEPELRERNDFVDSVEQFGPQRDASSSSSRFVVRMISAWRKSIGAPLRVGDAAVVENLQQNRGDVGVRLLDFVEEHDAVGTAAHRFGELPRLVVAGVARRRAEQSRDGVRFGELGEVDAHERGFAAEERFGERFRQLGLSDAARAAEEKRAQRFARIVQAGARAPNRFGNRRDRAVLTDDALAENPLEIEQPARLAIRSARIAECRSSA